jgi:hypothetical protein
MRSRHVRAAAASRSRTMRAEARRLAEQPKRRARRRAHSEEVPALAWARKSAVATAASIEKVLSTFLRKGATWRHARRGGSGLLSPRYDKWSGTALSR